MVFEEALHTYFAISDISGIAISGLASTTYIDKTDAARRKPQTDLVTITAEPDRVYLDTPARRGIEDRAWQRCVVIEKNGAVSTVVWNPWAEKAAAMTDLGDPAWHGMVCVEAGNIADNEVLLAPDAEALYADMGHFGAGETAVIISRALAHPASAPLAVDEVD